MGYFLYLSWMAFICGCSFCIFSAERMLVMRRGSSATLMMTVRMMIDMPQFDEHVIVRPLEPEEEGTGEEAEEAEIHNVTEIGTAGLPVVEIGMHRLEDVDGLGSDKQALPGSAV